ncbi:hypothetical protein RYH73_23565 [Olivibacter sp. CPCC 100613]|uniref:hypothetical protein n=1 Tax=Olivibacter sp. CPCC 100613 TaxID=3079931 RepID=UPI002FF92365
MVDELLSAYDRAHLVRIFVKGGMITPAYLMYALRASELANNDFIHFGSREDILFPVEQNRLPLIEQHLTAHQIDFEYGKRDAFQNIVSSAIALDITTSTTWLDLEKYRAVLQSFNFVPRLKINLSDPKQAMVPLFTGHLNFVASENSDYWHLYLRSEQNKYELEKWPTLIHSLDLPKLSKFIERKWQKNPKLLLADLIVGLAEHLKLNSIVSNDELKLPDTFFPYYEGLNNIDENNLWLGLYWRNNRFDIEFLKKSCALCIENHIPFIYVSPWKSFVIKGIKSTQQLKWEKLMGQMGINMRHSSLELNWHIPVLDDEALLLKRYLVQELDQQDICTHGLTFTIDTAEDKRWFTSIVIQKDNILSSHHLAGYNVLYAKEFNPNNTVYYSYAKQVGKEILPALLIELSKLYYKRFKI